MMGVGLCPRFMVPGAVPGAGSEEVVGAGAERLVLERLSGREKLYEGRGKWLPLFEVSELRDGERGRERATGDMGEWGIDPALQDDSLRGFENIEPPLELL